MRRLSLFVLMLVLALGADSQVKRHRVLGASGPPATSYANAGGTGNRTAIITVSQSDPSPDLFDGGSTTNLIDGSSANAAWFQGFTAVNCWMKFDFGTSQLITEIKWYQNSASTSDDYWQWQGSTDNGSWTNIGTTFQLGHATDNPHVITNMSGATTGYRYYRILGTAGTQNAGPYVVEIEFKLVAYP